MIRADLDHGIYGEDLESNKNSNNLNNIFISSNKSNVLNIVTESIVEVLEDIFDASEDVGCQFHQHFTSS